MKNNIYIETEKERLRTAERIVRSIRSNYMDEGMQDEDITVKTILHKSADKQKVYGYSCFQTLIDETVLKDNANYIKELLQKEKIEMAESGLIPKIAYSDYVEYDEEGNEIKSDTQTKLLNLTFILELNDGDYEKIEEPLSLSEEDGMRNLKSARELNKADREEDSTREDLYRPGRRHL